mmetsp:Transcript_1886/g.3629  ORF Transcript_1886/g.3629 Transcript_1886/m.3629 type:complete len:231 (+) Transcript_1886:47-739(+)
MCTCSNQGMFTMQRLFRSSRSSCDANHSASRDRPVRCFENWRRKIIKIKSTSQCHKGDATFGDASMDASALQSWSFSSATSSASLKAIWVTPSPTIAASALRPRGIASLCGCAAEVAEAQRRSKSSLKTMFSNVSSKSSLSAAAFGSHSFWPRVVLCLFSFSFSSLSSFFLFFIFWWAVGNGVAEAMVPVPCLALVFLFPLLFSRPLLFATCSHCSLRWVSCRCAHPSSF